MSIPLSCLQAKGLIVGQSVAAVTSSRAAVNAQRTGLSGHREATGVDTTILRQFDARTVHRGRRHLALSRRDADLHLVVLVQRGARGHSVTVVGHRGRARTRLVDGQREARRLVLLILRVLLVVLRVLSVLAVVVALRFLNGTGIGTGHTLHHLAVAVVAGNLDGRVGQFLFQRYSWSEDDTTGTDERRLDIVDIRHRLRGQAETHISQSWEGN